MDVELIERDGVGHFETCGIARPAAVVGSVEETVAEKDEVTRADSFPRDLLQFALLEKLPPWPDEFPVSKA